MKSIGLLRNCVDFKKILIVIILVFTVCVLIIQQSISGMYLKFFIGKLIYSTSNAAALFFMLYTLIVLVVNSIFTPPKSSYYVFFFISLLVAYLCHLTMVIIYFKTYQIPFDAYVYHWLNEINSFTSLMHSHQGKSGFLFFNTFLKIPFKKYDIGSPFFVHTSQALMIIFVVFYSLALFFSIRFSQSIIKQTNNDYPKMISILLSIILLLKNTVDGGILSYSTIPPLLIILCHSFRLIKIYLIGILLQIVIYFLVFGEKQIYFFSNLIFLDLSLIFLYTLNLAYKFHLIFKAFIVCYLSLNCYVDLQLNLLPLLKVVDAKKYRIIFCNPLCHEKRTSIELPLFLIYQKLGEDIFKIRHTFVINRNTTKTNKFYKLKIKILNVSSVRGKIKNSSQFIIQNTRIDERKFITMLIKNKAPLNQIFNLQNEQVIYKNNYYAYLYQINHFLLQSGVNEYIMLGTKKF